MRVAILTISDACAAGQRVDASGDAIVEWIRSGATAVLSGRGVVPDESVAIVRALLGWCDTDAADLVLTTGGTGLSPRDITPEAMRVVIDREAPGIMERLRGLELERFPRAALSRGVAGVRGRTLIVNLPGSPGGVRDALAALDPVVGHAVAITRGAPTDHSPAMAPR
jgi:molybdenum cofactor synthesis domain-containing protein